MTRLRALWDRLRGTYWAVPSAMAIASLSFSIVMVALDEALTDKVLSQWSWVYTGGAEGARAAFTEIAHYGRSSVSVSCRLLDAIRSLALCTPGEDDRLALRQLAAAIGDRKATSFESDRDHARVADCYRAAMAATAGPPRP